MPPAAATSVHPLCGIDRVVHEPARLLILSLLNAVDAADFLFVMRQTGLTQGNLSSHMTKLEAAGYLEIHKEFVDRRPRTLLRISEEGREALSGYVETMRSLLEDASPRQTVGKR